MQTTESNDGKLLDMLAKNFSSVSCSPFYFQQKKRTTSSFKTCLIARKFVESSEYFFILSVDLDS